MDKKIICNSSICHTEKVQFKVRIEELEERQKWLCATYLDCRARVKELEEGIEKIINFSSNYSAYVQVVDMRDELKKLIKKERP